MSELEAPPASATKEAWRTWARAKRSHLDFASMSEAVAAHLLAWPPLTEARGILTFVALADEVDVGRLREAGLQGEFYTTRTPERGGELTVHHLTGPLEVHPMGFLQPHASAPEADVAEMDVLLIPGLVFDLFGTRLGRGAGYYDALLASVSRGVPIAGVTPASLVVDALPRGPHDAPMSHLATDEGVVETAG